MPRVVWRTTNCEPDVETESRACRPLTQAVLTWVAGGMCVAAKKPWCNGGRWIVELTLRYSGGPAARLRRRFRLRPPAYAGGSDFMVTWNDTDEPIAYLITFRTYGTWLAGDERGSIDKSHNTFRGPRAESNVIREQQQVVKLKSDPFVMNGRDRRVVREAIEETCSFRGWPLLGLNVRTNHAHAVIAAVAPADKMLGDIKAYATRRLREKECWPYEHSPWVDKGSKRNLWNEDHVSAAIEYVINGQGDDLPEFD